MKLYHGTKEGEIDFGGCARYGTCFTDDEFIAAEYAEYNTNGGGMVEEECYDEELVRVYTVKIDVDEIADEDEISDIAETAGIELSGSHIWEDLDRPEVQDAIAAAGYDAVAYEDEAPMGKTHGTIRIVGDCEVEIVDEDILAPAW